jgi:hypothetical protein
MVECRICGTEMKKGQFIDGSPRHSHIRCILEKHENDKRERAQINLIKAAILELKQEGKL